MNPTISHPATDFRKPARTLFAFVPQHESKPVLGGLLLLLLCVLGAQAQTPPMPTMPLTVTNGFHFQNRVGHHWATNRIRHVVTNIEEVLVEQPCVIYRFYGLRHDGSLVEIGSVSDHDPGLSAFQKGPFDKEFRCVFRSEAGKLANVWQGTQPLTVQPDKVWTYITNSPLSEPEPVPEPANGGGASSVPPDTTAPVISSFALECGNITNFPTRVLFSANRVGQGWWHDPESGQNAGQIFDVQFPVQSNSFYTAWSSNNLTEWQEYPTPISLHPSRVNATTGMYFPILTNRNRFFTLRRFDGGTRTTWQ